MKALWKLFVINSVKNIWNKLPSHVGKSLSMSWDHFPMEIEFGLGIHWIRGWVNLKPVWHSNLHSWPTLIWLLKQSGELINVLINLLARLMVGHLLTIIESKKRNSQYRQIKHKRMKQDSSWRKMMIKSGSIAQLRVFNRVSK